MTQVDSIFQAPEALFNKSLSIPAFDLGYLLIEGVVH